MAERRIRILLAVDGSDQAFEAARYVSQLFAPSYEVGITQIRGRSS